MGLWARQALNQQSRPRALLEACVGYLLILAVIWTPRPWQRVVYWLPVLWIAGATWRSWPGAAELGLRTTHFIRSLWIAALAALLSVLTVALAAHRNTLNTQPTFRAFVGTYIGYALWAFVQQFLMMDFFLLRLLRVFTRPAYAVLTTAVVFALAHLPSPVLTPLTLIWGLIGCWHFLRYRNLYPLALAHAILGITLSVCIPGTITHNMRVGLGYLRYHRPGPRHRPRLVDRTVRRPHLTSLSSS